MQYKRAVNNIHDKEKAQRILTSILTSIKLPLLPEPEPKVIVHR